MIPEKRENRHAGAMLEPRRGKMRFEEFEIRFAMDEYRSPSLSPKPDSVPVPVAETREPLAEE